MGFPTIDQIAAYAIVIFFGLGLHEYAHAKLADMAGDPTPSYYGRVTLNLTKHFDPLGTFMIFFTMMAGVGIGWGKPVPMDPTKMKNPKWDHFIAVLGGPVTNLLQAAVYAIVMRLMLMSGNVDGDSWLFFLVQTGVITNIALFLFNLLPIGPLDGMWIFGTFLSEPARLAWTRWNLTVGGMVFLAIVLLGQVSGANIIGRIILPPMMAIFKFLTGLSL